MTFWWETKNGGDLVSRFNRIQQGDTTRLGEIDLHKRLYQNRVQGTKANIPYFADPNRVTLNVIKICVDAVTNRVARNVPRPRFLTSGGSFQNKQAARDLEKWVAMQFYTTRLRQITPLAYIDAATCGTGAVHVWREGTALHVERVPVNELYVEPLDAMYGNPTELYRTRFATKSALKKRFRSKANEIDATSPVFDLSDIAMSTVVESGYVPADRVRLIEAWKLPTSKGAKDGRYVCSLHDGTVLESRAWEYDCFPIFFLRWSEPVDQSFWGTGLADDLSGIQLEINRLLWKVQRAFSALANPQVWVEGTSTLPSGKLNNRLGNVNRYVGKPPVVVAPQTINPEVFLHIQTLYNKAFEVAGISQLTAAGAKPGGLNSGEAIREYTDASEGGRAALRAMYFDQFHIDVARWMVRLGKEIYAEDPGYTVVLEGDRHTVRNVKWSTIDLEEQAFVLQVFPSSALPMHPAGRLAAVQEMVAAGLIDPKTGKQLLGYPDLEDELSLDRAAADNIERMLDEMLSSGRPEAPEPYIDRQLALKMAQSKYNRALADGDVPESRLRLLRRFMNQVHQLNKLAMLEMGNPTGAPLPGAPPPNTMMGASPTAVTAQDGQVATQ